MSSFTQTIDDVKELDKFSTFAKRTIVAAFMQARKEGKKDVSPEHLFIGLLKNKKCIATRLLEKLGVDADRTLDSLVGDEKTEDSGFAPSSVLDIRLSQVSKDVLIDAFMIASEMEHVYVGTEHMLLSIIKRNTLEFVQDLEKVGLTYDGVVSALENFATYHPGVFKGGADGRGQLEMDDNASSIDTFTEDMNELAIAEKYLPIYGREEEVERLVHILSRKTKSNPILVGEAGVGKTAIVEGLVQRITRKEVPYSFEDKRVVNLDLASILAGSKIRGDVEERIISIVNDAADDPDIILFIDEIHMIVGAGSAGQGTMDIANILKPYLTSGDISVIGATTLDEYQRYFESDSALSRRFQSVVVKEINPEEAIRAMGNIKPKLEEFHKVKITDKAVEESVVLSDRYIVDRFLPDKAIDILDEASAGKRIKSEGKKSKYGQIVKEYSKIQKQKEKAINEGELDKAAKLREKEVKLENELKKMEKKAKKNKKIKPVVVDENDVRKVISSLTRIPIQKMDSMAARNLLEVEKVFEKQIIGQPDAIKKVSSAIKRAKVGIGNYNRPLASFLFLGPTGVGKTELAKTIAAEIFGNENSLIQIDMSEFMEQHSVSKLIGSPPGYVGYQEGGQLTEKIRRNPYTVILFDEIEKAHPDLLNILLQILEEGHVQDSKGRSINCKNTIIVLTSNIGAEEVSQDEVLGFNIDHNLKNDPDETKMDEAFEDMRNNLMEELKDTLRPELLNRIDDIIVFRGLDDTDITKIVKLEINKLNERIAANKIALAVSQGAIEFIANQGASSEYGARNVRRKIQELLENPLAELVLEKNMTDNDELEVVKVTKIKKGLKMDLK